ncbi:MAG: choice-of-anchor Q domain-containing protein, partial [Tepidisphaerales bacterium]
MAARTRGRAMHQAACEALEERRLLSTIYVDASSPGPTRDGTSWGNAYADLQLALGAAVSGDTIRVADGAYRPTASNDRLATFALKTGVAVYGGYAGAGASDPYARDVRRYPSILSGDIGAVGTNTDNSCNVVTGSNTDSSAILDGFTITAGNGSDGAGMYNDHGSPTIRNCAFSGNSVDRYGGGMYNYYYSSPTIINCSFVGNAASTGGGGMYNYYSSSPTIVDCTFVGNTASWGGGLYNELTSSPTLTNCTFSGNTANGSGGAVYSSSSATLTNCILWGNTASSDGQISGAAAVTYSDIQQTSGTYIGTGNINADPLFVQNPSSGTDGYWGTADDYGDLRICPASPVIDAGNNAAIPTGITTDLAGNPRRQDVAGVIDTGWGSAPIVDMGAYETNPGPLAVCGGPYAVVEYGAVTLNAIVYGDRGLTLSYAWDFNADGVYDDATGSNPSFSANGIWGPQTRVISLRVTDSTGASTFDTATITIVRPLYVDDTAVGANNGTSWTDACQSLQTALAAATAGQTIVVGQGTYKPTTTTNRAVSFVLNTGVAIYGGYAGVGAPDPYVRDVARYTSILSGEIGTVGTNTDNSYTVVTGRGSAILDGFTITAGYGSGGGGMYNDWGGPTVRNCTFSGNTAAGGSGYGGGMLNISSSPTLINCVFVGNTASFGGAIYNSSSSPTLANCTLNGNAASYGGAEYNLSSSSTLTNCILWGNTTIYGSQIVGAATVTYSDVQGGFTGMGNISVDPLFVRFSNTGTTGDLRLLPNSPAIDAGNNAAIPSGISTDLAGNPRRQDIASVTDTGSGTAPIVDMGAYEVNVGPLVIHGGPYSVFEGYFTTLNSTAYDYAGLGLAYAWDFDGDGVYDDATGPSPVFSASGMEGPQTRTISLRVTDSAGVAAFDTATVTIVHPVFVDDSASGANAGTSWTDAYQSLQAALAAATVGQTILVGQGTYKPTTTNDRSASFVLRSGVAIYGGFAGVGSADPYARNVHGYSSILSGDIRVVGTNSDNSYHVVVGSGTDSSAVLDGFTITGGNANGARSNLVQRIPGRNDQHGRSVREAVAIVKAHRRRDQFRRHI